MNKTPKDDAITILAVLFALGTFFLCGLLIWIYESLTHEHNPFRP